MKNFSMKRFSQVLKYDFKTGIRPILWFSLGMVIVFLLMFMWLHGMAGMSFEGKEPDFVTHRIAYEAAQMGCIFCCIFWLCVACTLFRDVQKKAPRTVMLMLPATNTEKFLSRWVYMLVFSVIGGFVAFIVADMLHLGWLAVTGRAVASSTPQLFKNFTFEGETKTIMQFYGLFFSLHSFALFGSVFFRKYNLVATFATGMAIFIMFMSIYRNIPWENELRDTVYLATEIPAIIIFTTLSYRIFCRWQVVTHKFVNL